ncbi:hypothetical protein LWI28_022098 [Acer negundo]|uniref:Uncharacterized protein n=1 Tax=Acer negundo TaxID=4023 RepID=A0AAD5JAG6_ACENE|nr:hypothetical protein LWI28_022098 [Acer negundo]
MVYIKHMVTNLGLNTWGFVFYNNLLSLMMSPLSMLSFFGFAARKAISATAFTVTGVVNKFLTVVINVMICDKHASPFGLVWFASSSQLQEAFFTSSQLLDLALLLHNVASKLSDNENVDDVVEEDQGKSTLGKLAFV